MQFGNLSGLVNGTEQVVFDSEVSGSSVSSIDTGSILNGDEDGWYTVIIRRVAGSSSYIQMRFNSDSGANYGHRGFYGQNTTVGGADAGTGETSIQAEASTHSSGDLGMIIYNVFAKSGVVRQVNYILANVLTGTTVTYVGHYAGVWSNTASNLVSMQFLSSSGNGFGVGSRIIILKNNNFTGGSPTGTITTPYIKGAWYRVGSTVLSGTASTVTFSSLDGDRDVAYYLSSYVNSNVDYYVRPNNDATSGNFGLQRINGSTSTVAASRFANTLGMILDYNVALGRYDMLLFAKKGYLRTAIHTGQEISSGTTMATINIGAHLWTDTSNNITSIVLATGGVGVFAIGSRFDLYALRPNA